MNEPVVVDHDTFVSAALPLLKLITHITGLKTSFITSINWRNQTQTVELSQNTGSLNIVSGNVIPWSESMCQLMISKGLTVTTDIQCIFPDSRGAQAGMQSFVVLPMKVADQTIGTLCGASAEQVELTAHQLESLVYIADALALQLKLFTDANYQRQLALRAEKTVISLRDKVENLAELANTDPLTGLLNRRAFQQRYTDAIKLCQRSKKPLALMMIDIDDFKAFNDSYGHETGDEIIKIVADGLQKIARSTDIPCRVGGDEFLLAAIDADSVGLRLLAERLCVYVKQRSAKLKRPCSLSIGIACTDQGAADDLPRLADEALYRSKELGRDQISIYCPQ